LEEIFQLATSAPALCKGFFVAFLARRNRPEDAESRWGNQPAVVMEPENSTGQQSKVQPHCN
jgi:hypothetical protein